jgi:hypothetical protein
MVSRRKLAAEAAPPLTSGIEEQTVGAAAGRASRTRRPRVTWITTVPSLVHSIDETGLIVAVSNK